MLSKTLLPLALLLALSGLGRAEPVDSEKALRRASRSWRSSIAPNGRVGSRRRSRSASRAATRGDRLWLAALAGDDKEVKSLLSQGADPSHLNLARPAELTALMIAASEGHPKVVRVLLKAKADLEERNLLGQTALHLACLKGHYATARVLVKAGALTSVKDEKGQSCKDAAQGNSKLERLLR